MITFLPAIVSTPFSKDFEDNANAFELVDLQTSHQSNESGSALISASVKLHQNSTSSFVSAPLMQPSEEENCRLYENKPNFPPFSAKSANSLQRDLKERCSQTGATIRQQQNVFSNLHQNSPMLSAGDYPINTNTGLKPGSGELAELLAAPTWRQQLQKSKGDKIADSGAPVDMLLRQATLRDKNLVGQTFLGGTEGEMSYNFKGWANSFRRSRVGPRRDLQDPSLHFKIQAANDGNSIPPSHDLPHHFGHQQRMSDDSSGFIETVKTASLSNDSCSAIPKSHRDRRGSEGRRTCSSFARQSEDSVRSTTVAWLDEGAVWRGIKRRHILREIVTSEEGYVADLKLLSNLFSTLLASISTLSSHVRSSIQRNVIELLHLHEHLLGQLHRLAFDIASRDWADTISLSGLDIGRRMEWKTAECHILALDETSRSQRRSASEALNAAHVFGRNALAEPSDATDVARVFKTFAELFFIYEEYSAEYEVMVHELARSHQFIPSWSLYDSGIEALAKSVIALNHRDEDSQRGVTVGDLLIKPIQRICKYPLLLADLLKYTPVSDCPVSHSEIESALESLREAVRNVNTATDDPDVRERNRRRWLLQELLVLGDKTLNINDLRMLGHAMLCGVLHIAYQTTNQVRGAYALCVLFKTHLVLATPAEAYGKFKIIASIPLADLQVFCCTDGRGLQCHSALYSWKIIFEANNQVFEVIFSACSQAEEDRWRSAMHGDEDAVVGLGPDTLLPCQTMSTKLGTDLKPVAAVFGQNGPSARRGSIQRAATVGNRSNICQVIIRDTHKPDESQQGSRASLTGSINRSQSLLTTHRTVVLAPKRAERTRLEHVLCDVWTKDTLPYPGMATSRGGHLIRASAGSLVRKLSRANLHSPFARRTSSVTATRPWKSSGTLLTAKDELELGHHTQTDSHTITGDCLGVTDCNSIQGRPKAGLVEPQTDYTLPSFSDSLESRDCSVKGQRRLSKPALADRTEESARPRKMVEDRLGCKRGWGNPIGLLRSLSAEGVWHMLYSS